MDRSLSEQQKLLLFDACKDKDGILSMEFARERYSSKKAAKNAVTKMESFKYIEMTSPGYWKVVKLPNDVKRELKDVLGGEGKGKSKSQKAPEDRESSSDFEIEAQV